MSKSATALLLVILFLTTSCSRSRPPKMEIVGSSKFDGGIVKISDGMNIRHQFRIRNSGGKPLLVFETKSSCGCTTVKVDKEIAPGEEGSIEVLLSMNRFTWGRKSATIVVTTNDVKNPQAIFDITAFAEFGISVNPATVNFGKIPALLESSRKIKIVATRDQLGSNADIQVKALSLGDKNSGMKVTFKRNDEPESAETENSSIFTDAIEMEVKVIPMQSGKNEANIQLQTNLKDYPEIIVPYSWEAYESVRIEPAQVHFGYLAQGSLSERTVKFISDDKKISFKSANVKNGSFKIVRIERQDDGTFDIDLQIQFDSKYQKIEDQLVVTSTDNKTRGVPLVAIRIL